MKKEDAIHILTAMKKSYLSLGIPDPEAVEALEMAIQAIQADYSEEMANEFLQGYNDGFKEGVNAMETAEPCEDAISRQAVLKTLDNMDNVLDEDRTIENYKELLKECYKVLPFVNPLAKDYNTIYYTPQPKTGHWIRQDNTKEPLYSWYFCSECNSVIGDKTKFCSNCGAKMEDK